MQSHKILITGANGLVGRVTAEYLAELGFQIVGIDKDKESQISPRFHMTQDTENVMLKRKLTY
jgi:nucleoside-diphosphate-sugar epimerase